MVRIELRQQRRRTGEPQPPLVDACLASARAWLNQSEFTSPEGHTLAKRNGSASPVAAGVEVISSSQRLRPSASRMGRE